jgi:hypothetical protein
MHKSSEEEVVPEEAYLAGCGSWGSFFGLCG